MIAGFKINNFRGIESLNIEDMRHITLLSGKNNIGKSSILEALFLMMDHASADSFYKLNNFRGQLTTSNPAELWEGLFYNMKPDNPIQLSIQDHIGEKTLIYKKDDSYIPNGGQIGKDVLNQFRLSAKQGYTLSFRYYSEAEKYEENGHYSYGSSGVLRDIRTSNENDEIALQPKTLFINNSFIRMNNAVNDWFGDVEISGNKKPLIDSLKVIDASIEDIVTVSVAGVAKLYIKTAQGMLPMSYAGDGVNKLLYILLAIMANENGLVLIDEIETGFHYSMYPKLWKMIADLSMKCNCQIVATTHSYECIFGALEGTAEHKRDFIFYRVGDYHEGLKANPYDADTLKTAFASDMEVR